MQLAILLLVSLALSCASTSAARPGTPSNVRQFDRLPILAEALNVAKSPYEPITLAPPAAQPAASVARTSEESLVATVSRLTPDEENLRTTRTAEKPEGDESSEQAASSSTARSLEESGEATSSTQATPDESTSETEANQAETSTETERVAKEELPTTTTTTTSTPATSASEPTSPESSSTTTQEPSEATAEPEVSTSVATAGETLGGGSVAPKEQEEVTTTREPETATTTAPAETTTTTATTTTTPAPETTPPPPQAPTKDAPPTTSSPEAPSSSSGLPESAENEPPKERPIVESETSTSTTSAPDLSPTSSEPKVSTELATEAPSGSSLAQAEREQQQPASTTTATTPTPAPATEPTSSQPPQTSSTGAPKLEGAKASEEDKSSCDHLPSYDSDEIQKVFREETTYKNGTIKGKFTYINFDQRYRLVHYTRLPYGPVRIDRVEELGKPGQGGSSSSPSSSSFGDVLQLRNLLPNSLFGFPFLGPHAATRPQAAFANRNEDPNTYFYSTDSLSPVADFNLLNPRPHSSSPARARTNELPGTNPPTHPATAAAHQDHQKAPEANIVQQPTQETYSKQLNRLEEPGELSPFAPAPRTGPQFQYSNPFQPPTLAGSSDSNSNSNNNKGFSYSYFSTSHSDYQPTGHYQPWGSPASSIYPAYPLRIGHQLNDHFESRHSHGHHQPHGHEHFVAPFMLSQHAAAAAAAEQLQSTVGSGSDSDKDNSRVKLQVKTSKALNLNAGQGQTKSAQLRLQPSDGHYSHLSSPTQMYQRNQQRQRLGKQSQQRHRSLMSPPANSAPVVYHVLTSPYNRRQFDQGHVMAYDQVD